MAYQDTIIAHPNLVAYWKLDETSGTTFVDSKNGYNGTISGGVTLNQTSLLASAAGKSAAFTTNGRAIITGSESHFDFERTDSWTIEAIVRPNITRSGGASFRNVFSKVDSSSPFRGYEMQIGWNGSNQTVVRVYVINDFSTKYRLWTSNSFDLKNATDYHIVAAYDGTTGVPVIYVNSQRVLLTTTSLGTMDATILNNITPTIGSRQATQYFEGRIDEIAVYNTNLPAATVQEHFLLAKDYTPLADPVSPPVIILDTDMASDVDDVADLAVLHRLADANECTIGAVITSANLTYSAPCVYAINDYYGRSTIPIGAYQGSSLTGAASSVYAQDIRDDFGIPGDVRTNYDDATTVYRQALHDAADGSVIIVLVGLFQCIADLLDSAADGIDSRNGVDLVAAKVNRIVMVAGVMPSSVYRAEGEYNIRNGPRAAAVSFLADCPASVPIQVIGIEMGDAIFTQPPTDSDPLTFPVKAAFDLWDALGDPPDIPRQAWGQLGVLYAVRGFDGVFGAGGVGGSMTIDVNSDNTWIETAGNVHYAVLVDSEANITTMLNGLLLAASTSGLLLANAAAAATASAVDPTAVLGSITVTAGVVAATASAADPTPIAGSVTVTPEAATAAASAIAPSITGGSLTVSPDAAVAAASAADPGVVLGAVSASPGAASASASAVAPTVTVSDVVAILQTIPFAVEMVVYVTVYPGGTPPQYAPRLAREAFAPPLAREGIAYAPGIERLTERLYREAIAPILPLD